MGDPCPAVSYTEFRSTTGLSPASIARGLKEMQIRGNIRRQATKRKEPARYRVIWEKFGISSGSNSPGPVTGAAYSPNLEFYFTDTGFLDLLPQATEIAHELGYGEDEMIQAVCLAFDKERTDPPTRNGTAWFTTVYREKLHEAHAQILAFVERQSSTS
jgi:hypothetical protein